MHPQRQSSQPHTVLSIRSNPLRNFFAVRLHFEGRRDATAHVISRASPQFRRGYSLLEEVQLGNYETNSAAGTLLTGSIVRVEKCLVSSACSVLAPNACHPSLRFGLRSREINHLSRRFNMRCRNLPSSRFKK